MKKMMIKRIAVFGMMVMTGFTAFAGTAFAGSASAEAEPFSACVPETGNWEDLSAEEQMNVPARRNAAYAAYLSELKNNEQAIRAYTWQWAGEMSGAHQDGEPSAITLVDVDGDAVEELIYASASEKDHTVLKVCSFDGSLVPMLEHDWDYAAAAGMSYCLFQREGEIALYAWTFEGGETSREYCRAFRTGLDGKLSEEDLFCMITENAGTEKWF